MPKNPRDERDAVGTLGAYAIGGAGLASARALSGLLGEGRSSLGDLGPAPIGSDPWLHTELRAALARATGVDATKLTIEVVEAKVTIRADVSGEEVRRIEAAAGSVQGIKSLRVDVGAA